MSTDNNWYVITGGPSSGKTTLIKELEDRGYKTIQEAARTVIDEAAAKGISAKKLRANEELFQHNVAKLKAQIEKTEPRDVITFFDRGMHDSLAYLQYYGYELESWITDLFKNSTYKKVFILEPLPTYEADYARTEDASFVGSIHKLLNDAYESFNLNPIVVPVMSVKKRASFILDQVKAG